MEATPDLPTRLSSGYEVLAPTGPLQDVVDRLYAYTERHRGPVWHRGLPSGSLTMIISVGPPVDVTMPGARVRRRHGVFVGGIHQGPARVEHVGHQRGVQLALRPEALLPLLGVPAGALAGVVVDLADLLPAGEHRRLVDRIGEADDLRGMALSAAAGLGELLRRRAAADPVGRLPAGAADPATARALGLLRRSRGTAPIAGVAEAVGMSRRHLGRRVGEVTGVPPKVLARLLRLDATLAALEPPPPQDVAAAPLPSFADLAVRLGYADQAHLSREVRTLTGASPSRLFAERAAGGSMLLHA